ncbi:MAG: ABC transporter permease [Bacteroidales bacterium]|nr:ABC transporter permease [Bacteroidales bacterium]
MKGVVRVFKREVGRMISQPIYLVMTIVIPLIVVLFFATFLNKGVPSQLPIAVIDFDNSSSSRQIVRTISSGQFCKVKYKLSSYEVAQSRMQSGDIYAFVIIPRNFQQDVINGKQPEVVFCTEYVHYLAGSLIMRELTTTLSTLSAGVNLKLRLAKGEDENQALAQVQPIKTDVHIIGNPTLNYSYYLSSIIMPGIIFLMCLICTIYAIGSELKQASSKRWLVLAERSMAKALCGKLLPYTIVFSLMEIFTRIVLEKYLGFPVHGSNILLYLCSILTVVAYQAVGIFISGCLPVMRTALSIGAFYGVLGFTLAGFTYPQFAMLPAVRPYTLLYPLTQYYNMYSAVQINALDITETWLPLVILLLFNILPLFILPRLKKAAVRLDFSKD